MFVDMAYAIGINDVLYTGPVLLAILKCYTNFQSSSVLLKFDHNEMDFIIYSMDQSIIFAWILPMASNAEHVFKVCAYCDGFVVELERYSKNGNRKLE